MPGLVTKCRVNITFPYGYEKNYLINLLGLVLYNSQRAFAIRYQYN